MSVDLYVPWQAYRDRDAIDAFATGRSKLIAGPTSEPITREELKAHSRIPIPDEDANVERYIKAARRAWSRELSRAFLPETWDWALDAVPCGAAPILLPVVPLISVVSVTTYDTANVGTVFASSNYLVDDISEPGRIVLNEGKSWPTGLRSANAVIVRYTAGYATADKVPEDLVHAVAFMAAHIYEHREPVSADQMYEIPQTLAFFGKPYRFVRV